MLKNNMRMTLLLSALIGLMLVSFATLPQAYASQVSPTPNTGGAGYFATLSSGEFTQITAEWNQPAITCQPSLGGNQVELEGLAMGNNGGSGGLLLLTGGGCTPSLGNPGYGAILNQVGLLGPGSTILGLTVTPGDNFSGSLTFSPSTGTVTADLTDLSTGQSASSAFLQPSTPIVFTFAGWTTGPFGTPGVGQNTLAKFSPPITFSHCSATVSGNTFTISQLSKFSTVSRNTMVGLSGNTMATTSPLSMHGSSFKVTWVSSA
jgi:hypothetical protein